MTNILHVVAHPDEAQSFPIGSVFVTGFGKVNAAVNLAYKLSTGKYDQVIVYGTAGRINPILPLGNINVVSSAFEYDSYLKPVIETDMILLEKIETIIKNVYPVSRIKIATGDAFVTDSKVTSALLKEGCSLIDMEAYAYIKVGVLFDIPVTVIKLVSDDADSKANVSWDDHVKDLSLELYKVYMLIVDNLEKI